MKQVRKKKLSKAVVNAFFVQVLFKNEFTDLRVLSYSATEGCTGTQLGSHVSCSITRNNAKLGF